MKKILLIVTLLAAAFQLTFAQRVPVTVTVTDESGSGLPGANVLIKGTTDGGITDANGKLTLNATPDAVLQISSIGYQTKEITVGNQSSISHQMVLDVTQLSEVVVTGYGVEEKKDIIGSVSVVKTTDLLSTPSGNVTNQLQGRSPGVTVSNDGTPGGSGKVRIRGFGSFNGSDPLYVIDGVPVTTNAPGGTANTTSPIDNLNPNDIESLQVLKDAAASSIYGARAANGVVIITTKKGKTGSAKITYDGYYGVNYVSEGRFPGVLNAQEYGQYKWQASANAGVTPNHPEYGNGPTPVIPEYIYVGSTTNTGAELERLKNGTSTTAGGTPATQLALFNSLVDPANYNFQTHQIVKSADTDWFNQVYNPAKQQSHQIAASGASEKGSYAMSLNYYSQDNTSAKTNFFHRYTLRSNTSYKIKNNIRVGQNAQFSYQESNTFNSVASSVWTMSPLTPVYDIMGNPASSAAPGIVGQASTSKNPVTEPWRNRFDRNYNFGFFGNAYAEVDIIKGLTARTSIGIDQASRRVKDFDPQTFEHSQNTNANSLTNTVNGSVTWTWTNTLTFSHVFAEKHNFKILVGSEAINFRADNTSATRQGYFLANQDDPNFQTLNAGIGVQTNTGTFERNSLYSLFTRADYSFADKYLINATLRQDQSSKFAAANRTGYFPAVGAGWRISSEEFMKGISFINDLKLRGSWGIIGNQTGLNFTNQYTTYTQNIDNSYPISGAAISTPLYRTQVGNPFAKWEQSITTNIGFDATLFNNSLDFSFEVYKKVTSGLLTQNQPPLTGTTDTQPYINAGNMQNTGIDIGLTKRGEIIEGLRYEVGLNFSHYKNLVTQIQDTPGAFLQGGSTRAGNATRTFAGQPVSVFYGYQLDGFYNTAEDVTNALPNVIIPPKLGRYKIKDVNGDGVINALDRTVMGSPHPKFQLGTNISLKYKNFDLTAFLFWNYGNKIFNAARIETDFNQFDGNRTKRMLYDSWTPTHTDAKLPIMDVNDTFSSTVVHSYFVEDASYLRLKTIQVGYTFPAAVTSKLKIDKLRIYVQGQNLFTVTAKSFSNLDPDQSLNGSSDLSMGVVNTSAPTPQQLLVGVSLGF